MRMLGRSELGEKEEETQKTLAEDADCQLRANGKIGNQGWVLPGAACVPDL